MMSDDAAGMRHSITVHHSYMWQIQGPVAKTQSECEFELVHTCDLQWFICDRTATYYGVITGCVPPPSSEVLTVCSEHLTALQSYTGPRW